MLSPVAADNGAKELMVGGLKNVNPGKYVSPAVEFVTITGPDAPVSKMASIVVGEDLYS